MKNRRAITTFGWIAIVGIGMLALFLLQKFGIIGGGAANVSEGTDSFGGSSMGFLIIPIIGILVWFMFIRKKDKKEKAEEREEPEEEDEHPEDPGNDPNPPKNPVFLPIPDKKEQEDIQKLKEAHPYKKPAGELEFIDLTPFFLPIRNQDKTGACGAFAGTSVFECIYNIATGNKDQYRKDAKRSELFLYYNARADKNEQGSHTLLLIRGMTKIGNCDYAFWPFKNGWDDYHKEEPQNYKKAEKNAKDYRIDAFSAVEEKSDEIAAAICNEKHPLWIIVDLPKQMRGGFSDKTFDKEPDLDRKSYHSMVIVGYDPKCEFEGGEKPGFKIRNSYGTGWGKDGYVWVSDEVLMKILVPICGVWLFKGWNPKEAFKNKEE